MMHKLHLVLQAPKSDRARLEEDLKKGATYRETEKNVKEARAAKPEEETSIGKRAGTKKTAKANKARAKKEADKPKRMTIAAIEGTKTIRLFKKGTDDAPAKRLGDQPWGSYELSNDVSLQFAIMETSAGELVLKLKVKRDE